MISNRDDAYRKNCDAMSILLNLRDNSANGQTHNQSDAFTIQQKKTHQSRAKSIETKSAYQYPYKQLPPPIKH